MSDLKQEIRDVAKEEALKNQTKVEFPDVQRVSVENWPEHKAPEVNVTVPEMKPVVVPAPQVNVETKEVVVEQADLSALAEMMSKQADLLKRIAEKENAEIDYEKLDSLLAKNKTTVTGHGGVSSKRVFLNTSGQAINPATADNQTNGAQKTKITSPLTGFGEINTAENVAFIQAAPVYNLLPANFRTFTSGSGTAGVSELNCASASYRRGFSIHYSSIDMVLRPVK